MEDQPWGFDPKDLNGYKVVYSPDISKLIKWKSPISEHPVDEFGLEFKFAKSISGLGSIINSNFYEEAKMTESENGVYWDFVEDFVEDFVKQFSMFNHSKSQNHQILGHSQNIQNDMQEEAQLVMNGYYCGEPFEDVNPKREKLKENAEDWMLLLQIDSDDRADIIWGSYGMIYFWIRKEDLAKRNFDGVWTTIQCT